MSQGKSIFSKFTGASKLIFANPYLFIAKVLIKHPFNRLLNDKHHISLCYRGFVGRRLDWSNIKTFNEKLQWLKLFDRQEWYWTVSDKARVREFVTSRIGSGYLIPLIAVYDSVDEIDFDLLPKQFVLKCTHDSGSAVLCEDKSKLNYAEVAAHLRSKLRSNYYYLHREYQYYGIKPRIVCEEYIALGKSLEPIDYKFLCFNGEPKFIQVDTGRYTDHRRLIMNTDWTRAPFDIDPKYSNPDRSIKRPEKLEEMLDIASKLSRGFRFVRVDLYAEGDRIYFGELTFLQGSGYDRVEPPEYSLMLGELIDIDTKQSNHRLSLNDAEDHIVQSIT